MAGPNTPFKSIETVQIIHAEVDLEAVIRKVAIALETHLKLPGKADFDTDKEYKASHIIDQLKGVIDQRTYSVLYITDDLLKLFKEDRKLQGTLRDLLKKNEKLGGGSGKPIAILWAIISDINLVKATLNVKYKNVSQSFAKGLSMGNFALPEMGNLVEAVQKIWLGDAATLPSAFPDPEPVDVPHRSSSCTDIGKDLGVVNELPFPGLSIVYFGTGQLKIVTQLATCLMIHMREEASHHYFTFFKSDKDDSVKKIMMQMKGLSSGHFRVVLILSKELLELLKEIGELDEFGRICARTSGMKPPQVTFLTERILLEDVQGYSRSLGVTITERCFLDIDPEKLDELAFNLKQIFDDGRRAEPVEDEDLSWRETKKEHINDKRRVVISSGESLVMPDDFNATGPSLTSVINRQLTDPRPIDAIDDGDSPRSVPAGHFSVGDSACGATDMEQRSDTFSRYYEKQEKTTKTDPCPSDGGKAHSENGCTVALPKIENSHDNFSLDSPGSAKGVADKPHSLKSKSNSVSFADSRTLHQLPTKQQESISGKGGSLHSKETATSSNAPPNYDGDAMAIKPNQVPPHTHGFHQNHQGAHKHPPMDHLQGRHEVQPNHRPHSNPSVGEFMSLLAQSPEFRSQVLTFLNHPGGMYPMSQFQMAHQQHPGSSYPVQQPASTSNYAQRGTYAASQQQHQQQPLNAVHPASTIQSGPSTFMHAPLPQQQQQPQGYFPTQPSPIPSSAARPRLMTSQSVPGQVLTLLNHPDKESLFLKCLQQKMKSWFETMTPVPWKKSCQWKSNDLFIASGLVLTNSGLKVSGREVDQKFKLHYLDIFTDERLKAETRIILEGQPGSGKTMLSSQLAYDWCCGKLMDIPIVIYLPLKIVDNMTIIETIKMFYIRKGIPITEEDIESMLNSGKKKVYLILDGLEEYNGGTKDGSPSEIMRVMTKEKLSNCIVMITARTDFAKDLPPGPMLKIGSFGEDERNEYIEKVYSDDLKRQEEVKELIDNIPFILDLCNVPLLFVLLVHNIDRLGKLQEGQLDRVTPFMKAIVDILCSVQDKEDNQSHLSNQQQESVCEEDESRLESEVSLEPHITLEELAFNGLCKGNQQLFWQKNFVDRCVSYSKTWTDAGLLIVEEGTPNSTDRNLQTDSGSGTPQTDSISDESLNTSNVTSEIKRGVSPDLSASVNQSESKPILESKEKKSKPLQKGKAAKYVSLQVKFFHKLIQEWFAAKYLARLFCGHKSTKHLYKYQLFREHLANIDPADLHYVLRFTCHICPPSFHVIASFLIMRDFETGDREIPDYIMNCICLCFAEYDGYKGDKVKDIVKEVCRRESVNFSSEDSRLLLKSKVSMLTFASRSQIPIKCLKLSDVVEKITEKALILKADVSLGVLKTLRAIEVNRWDLKLIEQDYEDLIKFVINNEMVEEARLLFPSPPVTVNDAKDLKNLQSRNISVKWIIGAHLIHTLNVTTGEWMMDFRIPGRMSANSSSLKPISDNLPSNPLQMELWINKDGGVLELPGTGVSLEIPPGALEKDWLIQMRIIPYNFQGDSDLSFSSNSSVVVELLPSNLKLLKPVILTLPHCLVLKKGCEWKAKIYSSHHEEGNQPVWRPQPDTPYVLTERNCVIKLKNFSWEKIDIGDEIVDGKRIVLYAAKDLSSSESITEIHVGYYLELPGGEEIVSINEVSVLVKQPAVFFKQGKFPLTCHFVKIKPPDWTYDAEEKKTKEISFKRVASCNGGFCTFVLNIKEGTQERHNCKCHFEAGQESELVELLFILKNPSLPSHQAIRGEAEGNPVGAEAMTKDSEVVTKETLQDLSGNLTEEWRDVGRKLKLEETDICNIVSDNRDKGQKEVIYQMLLLWKQKRGMAATNNALIDALREARRQDLHDNFLKFGKFGTTSVEGTAIE